MITIIIIPEQRRRKAQIQASTEISHTGHCTQTADSINVTVQNCTQTTDSINVTVQNCTQTADSINVTVQNCTQTADSINVTVQNVCHQK